MLRFGQISHSERKQNLRGTARVASTNLRRDGLDGNVWENPVIDDHTGTPPVAPEPGDRYIIPCGATGAWLNRTGQIAEWVGNAWQYTTPTPGTTIWVLTRNYLTTYLTLPGVEGPDADIDIETWLPHHLIDASHTIYPGQVTDRLTTPPVGPALYALYIVTTVATGAWAGHEDQIAVSVCNALTHARAWAFIHAQEGDFVWVMDENLYYVFDGSAWVPLPLWVLNRGQLEWLANVSDTPGNAGDVLTLVGGVWTPVDPGHDLGDHDDTDLSNPQEGDLVYYDGDEYNLINIDDLPVNDHTLGIPHSNVDDTVDSAPADHYLGTYGVGVWKEFPFPDIPPEFDPGDIEDRLDALEAASGGGTLVGIIEYPAPSGPWVEASGSGYTVAGPLNAPVITFSPALTAGSAFGISDSGDVNVSLDNITTTWNIVLPGAAAGIRFGFTAGSG